MALGAVTIISAAAMNSNVTFADEITTSEDISVSVMSPTNLKDNQGENSKDSTELSKNSNQTEGNLVNEITSEDLNKSVATAKSNGVEVTETEKVTHKTLDEANKDLEQQKKSVDEATKEKEKNTQEIQKATDTNNQIDQENASEKKRIEEENAKNKTEVDNYNAAETEKVNKINAENIAKAKALNIANEATYQAKVKELANILKENEEIRARNAANLAETEKRNKEAKEAYEKAKAKYEADKANAAKATEANKTSKSDYEAKLAEYNKLKEQYDKDKAAYDVALNNVKTANAAIENENRKIMESRGLTYTGDYSKDKATVDNYNANLSSHATISESNRQAWDNAVSKTQSSLPDSGNGYTPSGSSTFLSPVTLDNGVQIVGTGSLAKNNVGVILRGNVDESKVINSINWGNTALEGDGLRTFTPGDNNDIWGNTYNYSTDGANRFYIAKTKTWYKISNLITTLDGKTHDGWVMFDSDPSGLHSAYNGTEVAVWNAGGAVNALDGGAVGSVNNSSDAIRTIISLDTPNNNDNNIIWINHMTDIDGGQFIDGDYGKLIGVGGGMSTNTSKVSSDENLGFTYGINKDSNALNGLESAPDGAVLIVQTGVYSNSLRNTPGGNSAAVARSDFGSRSSVSKTIIKVETPTPISIKEKSAEPTPPTAPTPPTQNPDVPVPTPGQDPTPPVPEDFTPEKEKEVPPTPVKPTEVKPEIVNPSLKTYEPKTPTVKPHVEVPKTLNVKANVHKVEVLQTPDIIKDVVNEDNISTNGHLVPKGSTQTWTLETSSLKAGRPVLTSIEFDDPFANGFNLDVEAINKLNTDYVFKEVSNGTSKFVMTKEALAKVNKDRNSDYTLPKILAVGSPINDGGTYENTFKIKLVDASGKIYTKTSNTPVIYTPGHDPKVPRPPKNPNGNPPTPNDNLITPTKKVIDNDGVDINGKSVLPNSTLTYVLREDLDQYKDIVASKQSQAKGFAVFDNPTTGAFSKVELVSAIATNGDDITSLYEMIHVLSDSGKNEMLSQILASSGYQPKGEYYAYVVKDPQAFYEKYVKNGISVDLTIKAAISEAFAGRKIDNTVAQVDFGNGYTGNTVSNNIDRPSTHKSILDKDNKAISEAETTNGSEVKLGDKVPYKLDGWIVPANRGYDLYEYKFYDNLDETHDEYNSYTATAITDITLTDGTKISKGSDLKEYTVSKYNSSTGELEVNFKEDFLSKIPRTSEFGADVVVNVTRIKDGTVVNQNDLFVNGNKVVSNEVKTYTKPKETPQQTLPKTGDTASASAGLGIALISMIGLAGTKKKKEN